MKIAIFNWRDITHPQAGGAETYLYEQAKIWIKQGHDVVWFAARVKGRPNIETVDKISIIRAGNKATMYLLAPLYYMRYMLDSDVVIDAENGFPFFTPFFSNKKKILLIHHIHKDVWFKGDVGKIVAYIGYFLETKIMPIAYKNTQIITVSQSSKDEIEKLMPKSKVQIVYNAVSDDYVPGSKSKTPEVIFLGRLKKYKGIDIMLRAISLVDKNLKVNLVGRGDDETRLKEISKELGLKNVHFLGYVSEKAKKEYLQKAWVAINPSFVEGWSITNIEANASGTIVLGSRVHGVKDSIIDKKTGLLFTYGDEKDLASKLQMLLSDKKMRENMQREAIKFSKRFRWKESAEKFLRIINSL